MGKEFPIAEQPNTVNADQRYSKMIGVCLLTDALVGLVVRRCFVLCLFADADGPTLPRRRL
jgi:hypothetical protein